MRSLRFIAFGLSLLLVFAGCKSQEKVGWSSYPAELEGVSYHGLFKFVERKDHVEIVSPIGFSADEGVSVVAAKDGESGFAYIDLSEETFPGESGELIFLVEGKRQPYEISVKTRHDSTEQARQAIDEALAAYVAASQSSTGPKSVGEVIQSAPEEVVVPVPDIEVTTPSLDFDMDMTIEPGYVAKSLKEWIPEYHRVDAVLYDYTAGDGPSLVQSGKLHQGVVGSYTKTLSKQEVAGLESLVTGSRSREMGALCYLPHHGFVFYDAQNKILGHLEVCLMCQNYRYAPRSINKEGGRLSDNWDLKGMEKLLKDKGFPVLNHPDQWEAFFKEQK